jgi:hypothetical protein
MTSYKICIPSYKRAGVLNMKTLLMLEYYSIPKDLIYIFVANAEEYNNYVNIIGDSYRIIIGEVGMMNIRNFITNYFDEREHLVMIDDDITLITHFEKYYKTADDFFTNAFELCIENKCRLWGIYPVNNAYFMKPTITIGLQYICGGLYGVINNKKLLVSMNDKEDFQRSIQYYLEDGKTMRFNYVGINTKGYTGVGGMNIPGTRTNEIILASAVKLTEAYPYLAKLNMTKASGKPEVTLKRIILKVIEI